MTINLSQFVNKEVTVTLRNGETHTGIITRYDDDYYNYRVGTFAYYTFDARYYPGETHRWDIIKIVETTPKQMNNKQQLLQSIKDTEAQLNKLKEQLEAQKAPTTQEAKVGDTLEDGSIVLKKENGLALVVAPKSTQVECQWTKQFCEVFDKLFLEGFIPSQWFVPTVTQLQLAYKVIPDEFKNERYWSSGEYDASYAFSVFFDNGNQRNLNWNKDYDCSVRAFRCISY